MEPPTLVVRAQIVANGLPSLTGSSRFPVVPAPVPFKLAPCPSIVPLIAVTAALIPVVMPELVRNKIAELPLSERSNSQK